jgi:hypothetical protein
VTYGDYTLHIPSPISGTVLSVNSEHAEHPEWLAIKPFELSWMCRIEPSDLAAELPGLRIGHDAVEWYQQELDRYSELAGRAGREVDGRAPDDSPAGGPEGTGAKQVDLLARFSEPFLQW